MSFNFRKIFCFLLTAIGLTGSANTFYSSIYSSCVVKGYKAKIEFNGQKCSFRQDLFRFLRSMPSQYSLSDSCFYLTFELSPMACQKGEKTAISVFVVFDSIPETGVDYPLVSLPENHDSDGGPIVRWTRQTGNISAIQMVHMPVCKNAKQIKGNIDPSHSEERIILTSTEIYDGKILFEEIEPYSKDSSDYRIKLKLSCNGRLLGGDNDEIEMPLSLTSGDITLYLVQHSELEPLLFPIDYGWGYNYLPKNKFDRDIYEIMAKKSR